MAGRKPKTEETEQPESRYGEVVEAVENHAELEKMSEQAVKEAEIEEKQAIAKIYEYKGRIQTADIFRELATVSGLIWLKEVKDSKLYKKIPGLETWEKFCEITGKSRRLVDEQLINLDTFGSQFLETVSGFGIGYRELRQLRKLNTEEGLTVDSEAVEIGGEKIPLTPDSADDLKEALERLITEKDKRIKDQEQLLEAKDKILETKNKQLDKLDRDLAKATEVKTKPKTQNQADLDFQREIDNVMITLEGCLITLDPDKQEKELSTHQKAVYLSALARLESKARGFHDDAKALYGHPDVGWEPRQED